MSICHPHISKHTSQTPRHHRGHVVFNYIALKFLTPYFPPFSVCGRHSARRNVFLWLKTALRSFYTNFFSTTLIDKHWEYHHWRIVCQNVACISHMAYVLNSPASKQKAGKRVECVYVCRWGGHPNIPTWQPCSYCGRNLCRFAFNCFGIFNVNLFNPSIYFYRE